MSIARGVLRGFIAQGIDTKVAEDQRLAEFNDKVATMYLNNKLPDFLENEENINNRTKLIENEYGKPAALFASAKGVTLTDAGTERILNLKDQERKNFIEGVSKIDFQNYDYETNSIKRAMKFNEKWKGVTDTFVKKQGGIGKNTIDLTIPIPEDKMKESTFDASTLPSMTDLLGTTSDTAMRDFVPKEDRPDLRTFVTFFNSNIADPNLGGYENITKNYPSLTVADDPTITYQNLKDVGYTGSELDFAREKYLKQRFAGPSYNVNYKTDYEEFENKVKERRLLSKNIRKDLDLPQTISDPKDLAKTKSEAFAFGDVATTESVKYTEDLDAINISLSNAIAKILADVSLDEETKNSAIERIKIAAANKKKELGPAPTTTTTGPLIP